MVLGGTLLFSIVQDRQAQARNAEAQVAYTAPTYTPPRDDRTTVAFLGDSFTAGTGASSKSNRWTSRVSKSKGWRELNYGVGGTNFGSKGPSASALPYVERLTDLIMSNPDIVVVSSAGNSLDKDQTEEIAETFETLRAELPDTQIIATSPYTRAGTYPEHLETFGDDVRDGVESVGGTYVDIGHPLESRPEGMAKDGVHPNDKGYELIAEAVEEKL